VGLRAVRVEGTVPRWEASDEIEQSQSGLGHVLGWLGRSADVEARPVPEILGSITETAARTLGVARVNVWLYDETRAALNCIEGFDARTGRHDSGEKLLASEHPSYFHSLELLRHVSALHVHEDQRTRELDHYLQKHDITTILDVPMLRSGHVFGVVCHEHVGEPRSFGNKDRLFAGSVGDLVTLVLETAKCMELERERAQLRQSVARMAQIDSLGWLAAGVAHDFRNLLMVIHANAEFLERALSDDQEIESVNAIASAVRAASGVCDQLQAYAGKGSNVQRDMAIDEAIGTTVEAFRARLPAGVQFDVNVDTGLRARLDGTAIGRAVMNLLVNALEALPPSGGKIGLIVRESEPAPAALSRGYDFRTGPGQCALIEVNDTGSGIAPPLVARISDPFFTTKARGSGFGLATVLGAVRAHHGVFHVESAEGRGSRFCVWIPLVEVEPESQRRIKRAS
jgi:two-component system cell cycle sensor histidine kinase/response regulator CckA